MTLTVKRQQQITKASGWNRLDPLNLDVEVQLDDSEIAQIGHELADTMGRISELEEKKKQISSELGDKIKSEEAEAHRVALEIRNGHRMVEKLCPGFYDPKTKERVYLDPDTEEEVYRTEQEQGDEQIEMDKAV